MIEENDKKSVLSKKLIMGLYESHNFKNVSKVELKVFQNLHQLIKNDYEWVEFAKLF
jgi:hypothetical protein